MSTQPEDWPMDCERCYADGLGDGIPAIKRSRFDGETWLCQDCDDFEARVEAAEKEDSDAKG